MSSAGFEFIDVYLGATLIGLNDPRGSSTPATHWVACNTALAGWEGVATELVTTAGNWSRMQVRIWLSGALARPFLLRPVQGLRNRQEASALAVQLAAEATGLAGPCTVWLDGWRCDEACAAVAMEHKLRNEIELVARRRRVRITRLQPWWAGVLDHATRSAMSCRLLSVADSDSLTIVSGDAGQIDLLGSYVPVPSSDQVEAILTRRALSDDVKPGEIRRVELERSPGAPTPAMASSPRAPFIKWIGPSA